MGDSGYQDFVVAKLGLHMPTGLASFDVRRFDLFEHQRLLAEWALRRGRCAIFADTGLGKSRMQLVWADQIHREAGVSVLILAPLAVAAQTCREGASVSVSVTHARSQDDVRGSGIYVTNYDRLHLFDPASFGAVVLDESSCIKHHGSKRLAELMRGFHHCAYRLCATATPAPNDWTELGTHAEFLGICTRAEMLAEFFVHDAAETQVWRLKGHAQRQFWRWVASWAAMVRRPSDLGLDDSAYVLPPLVTHQHTSAAPADAAERMGQLVAVEAQTLSQRRNARKASMTERVRECADLVNDDAEQWLVWCDLNAESDALAAAIPGAVVITGADDSDYKERALLDFSEGRSRVLITKPKIAGWGVNLQGCARQAFVGVTDSFEAYYQCVRRSWRFGQTREVHVHIFTSELEGAVVRNVMRKESDASEMAEQLAAECRDSVVGAAGGQSRTVNEYRAGSAVMVPAWLTSEG